MIEASIKKNIFSKWFAWHFFEVPKKILKGYQNFLVFNINYFSIPQLLKTFFSHWRRYRDSYGRGFDLKRYVRVAVGNFISRVLGIIIRTITIIIGLTAEFLIFLAGLFVFIIWLILPFIVVFLFVSGFNFLI